MTTAALSPASSPAPAADPTGNTRQAILDAAKEAFSTKGYAGAGVREITAAAGVSMALVNRYFGSKERLFEEALAEMLGGDRLMEAPRERFGEVVAGLLLSGDIRTSNPLSTMMLASADPGARAIAQRLVIERVYEPLARWFGPKEGHERAARFMFVSAGLTVYTQIFRLDVLQPEPAPSIREWLVREFQALAD